MHMVSSDIVEASAEPRVLVVARDDRREAVLATLATLHVRAEVVGSGVEGLYAALTHTPCLFAAVVLDHDLPGMTATDTLRALRLAQSTRGVPVILIDVDVPEPTSSPAFDDRSAGPVESVPGHAQARLAARLRTFVDLQALRIERDRMASELRQSYRDLAESTARLEQLVQRDPLTGLVNPAGLQDHLQSEQERSRATGNSLFAVFVDLDRFESLNRRLGQSGGDQVLRSVAASLREHTVSPDIAGRVGSDEFLVLLADRSATDGLDAARAMAATLCRSITGIEVVPNGTGEAESVTATLAVVRIDTRTRLDVLLHVAREGIAVTRLAGRNRWAVVGEAPDSGVFRSMSTALANGAVGTETRAAAQAIFRVADEAIVGCELLIRGTVGPLSLPRDFEQLYSSADPRVLHFVDRHCLYTCADAVQQIPRRRVQVNVNLFPSTLLAMGADAVADRLFAASPTTLWCVELSEHLCVDDPVALAAAVERLRLRGIRIAVDDVGFGNSSLEGILRLAPDILKIDRRFVTGVTDDPTTSRRDALRRIVALAGALGAELIAEGVETRADLVPLAELGVHYAQGWLWGRPGDPAEVLDAPTSID